LHRGARLRAEVLDDDLLEMVVAAVELADREERLSALAWGLADADEDAGRERDGQATGVLDRPQAHGRLLVGRAEVRSAPGGQPLGRRLQHQPHRGAHVLESGHLLPGHDARIQVRQQARLLDHSDRDRAKVLERRPVAALGEPCPCDRIAVLRPVAEREQRLLAAGPPARVGDGHDLLR
jgi:hypothetical protein